MNPQTIRIGIDVGSARHRVAVGLPDGKLIDEFDLDHHREPLPTHRRAEICKLLILR